MDMKYKVTYLPLADKDISRICDALADYPNKAKRLFQEIEKKIKMLEEMPYTWPVYQIKPKYRQMVLEDHLLFYMVNENEHEVRVYRVLYSKMDAPKHI
jgi:plasmid stabilization system protein ParE